MALGLKNLARNFLHTPLAAETGIPIETFSHRVEDAPHASLASKLRVGLFFEAVIKAVENEEGLSLQMGKEIVDDVRHFCLKWIGRQPEAVPADAHSLRNYSEGWTPEKFAVSQRRYDNVWGSVRRALRIASVIPVDRKPCRSLGQVWRALNDDLRVAPEWLTPSLSPFIRYCDSFGIAPEEVTDGTVEAFATYRHQFDLTPDIAGKIIAIRSAWNRSVDIIPAWPQLKLSVGKTRKVLNLPEESFPPSFRLDIERYTACRGLRNGEIRPGMTLLEEARATYQPRMTAKDEREGGVMGPLAEATLAKHAEALWFAASAMVRLGHMNVEDVTSIADIADVGIADRVINDDIKPRLGIESQYGGSLVSRLRSIAERWVPEISQAEINDFAILKKLVNNKAENLGRMPDKDRRRLAPFLNDLETMAVLLCIPRWEFENLERERRRNGGLATRDMALRAEAAIGVLLQETLCVRWGDFRRTRMDVNIIRPTRRGGVGTLHYKIRKTHKNGITDAQAALASWKTRLIEIYWNHYRPKLTEDDPINPYLFPGAEPGAAKSHSQLGREVTQMVNDWTGHYVNPHLWRKLMGGYLLYVTHNLELVAALLGHRPDSRATNVYVEIKSKWAADELDQHAGRLAERAMRPKWARRQ
ncbi:site-specific integrase [Shumkonia mesophila]|uniref:hypothetical protein n=1 Tax=Shumkonia mesophila TaxID=2838854 RepID=UPI002934132D|nr:hypothetical protein [Shumkonia mesophila]